MQVDNPMAVANLLTTDRPELNKERKSSRCSSNTSYPPPSLYCSTWPTHNRITLPSPFPQLDPFHASRSHEMDGLAIRPHLGANEYYHPYTHTQTYYDEMQNRQTFQWGEWVARTPTPGGSVEIEITYQKSRGRACRRTLATRHRKQAQNADLSMPCRKEISVISSLISPPPSPQLGYDSGMLGHHIAPGLRRAHSNAKYPTEQVDFFRYQKEDVERKWGEILEMFAYRFADQGRDSEQCLTSRFYRDNIVPMVNSDWQVVYGTNGKVKMQAVKVRERKTDNPDGVPYRFIDKHPVRALTYDWVHPEHKKRALEIIEWDKRAAAAGCLTIQGKWRRAILEAEESRKTK